MILLYGEGTPASGHYRVRIDHGEWSASYNAANIAASARGNTHHVQILAEGLNPSAAHTLELQPQLQAGQELRIESLCVAGGPAPFVSL